VRKGTDRNSWRIASWVIPRRRTVPHRFTGRTAALTRYPLGSGSDGVAHVHVIGKMRQLPQHRVADYESKSLKVLNYW